MTKCKQASDQVDENLLQPGLVANHLKRQPVGERLLKNKLAFAKLSLLREYFHHEAYGSFWAKLSQALREAALLDQVQVVHVARREDD